MTARTLELLSQTQRHHLAQLNEMYNREDGMLKDEARGRIREYLNGMRDCNFLTENQCRSLFCYYTLTKI